MRFSIEKAFAVGKAAQDVQIGAVYFDSLESKKIEVSFRVQEYLKGVGLIIKL
jgi:hypothetical protein